MARPDTLLIDAGPGETRIAVLAASQCLEVHYARRDPAQAGALFVARVMKRAAAGEVALIDLGFERPAVLNAGAKVPPEGTWVVVEVIQPARDDKGPKVKLTEGKSEPPETGRPVLLRAAPDPLAWCCGTYKDTLAEILVTPVAAVSSLASDIPDGVACTPWTAPADLFEDYGVETALAAALERSVPLPSGGSLLIEPTAAFTAVDINAGAGEAAAANMEAMAVLVREMRLRAIGGPVIVDVIPVKGRTDLITPLKAALADDPVPVRIAGFTPEGRLELNRRRLRPSLSALLTDGAGGANVEAVAYEGLRHAVRVGFRSAAARVAVAAHEDVVALLQGRLRPALVEAEERLKTAIVLSVHDTPDRRRLDVTVA